MKVNEMHGRRNNFNDIDSVRREIECRKVKRVGPARSNQTGWRCKENGKINAEIMNSNF